MALLAANSEGIRELISPPERALASGKGVKLIHGFPSVIKLNTDGNSTSPPLALGDVEFPRNSSNNEGIHDNSPSASGGELS